MHSTSSPSLSRSVVRKARLHQSNPLAHPTVGMISFTLLSFHFGGTFRMMRRNPFEFSPRDMNAVFRLKYPSSFQSLSLSMEMVPSVLLPSREAPWRIPLSTVMTCDQGSILPMATWTGLVPLLFVAVFRVGYRITLVRNQDGGLAGRVPREFTCVTLNVNSLIPPVTRRSSILSPCSTYGSCSARC
jgi:hypothetical protein